MSLAAANSVIERIGAKFGPNIWQRTSVQQGLAKQMGEQHFGTILEIGTFRGLSSIVLAQFAANVITIDIERQPEVEQVLAFTHFGDRVAAVVVPDNLAKALLIGHLRFDMAFIDGAHTFVQAALDFGLVRRCGNVLFHDWPDSGSGAFGAGGVVDQLIESGDGRIETSKPFAWWRAK